MKQYTASMKYILSILMLLNYSCNTVLFADKSKIVHNTEGYLLYYRSEKCLFIPSKDTSINQFLNDTLLKKGYLLLPVCGRDGLKFTSKKFDVNMVYLDNKQEYFLPDSIFLTTTSFRYLLNQFKSVDFNDTIEFEHKGKRIKIDVSDNFYGEILKFQGNAM